MQSMKNTDINLLFEPRSIAVIGASHNPDKVGYKILENIIDGGYKGKIYPVNNKGGEILRLPVYKNICEINDEIDVAIVSVPADIVFEVIKDCPNKVKFLIIVSAGFSEIGNVEEEKRIVDFARQNGIRVLGPNIFGIYCSGANLNATFGTKGINKGNVAIISQSGALGIALMGKAQTERIRLSSIVFEGNKADLNETDLLPYFKNDKNTKVVFVYLEGVKQGQKLVEVLKEITKIKPVVLLKAGVSQYGAKAAMSHTGSLSGEERVFSSAMQQSGVIRARNLRDAISWVKYLTEAKIPSGNNCLIITNGGGMGILASDICEKYKIKLFDDEVYLKEKFIGLVRGFGSAKNPIDITGEATAEDYQKALEIALKDRNFDSIICLGCETAVLNNKELARVFEDIYQRFRVVKPLVFAFVGGREVDEYLLSLKDQGVPIFSEIEDAVSCLGAGYKQRENILRPAETVVKESRDINFSPITRLVETAIKEKRKVLMPSETRQVMELLKIALPESVLVKSEKDIFAQKINYPVVAKIVSKDIIHKTDAGGVIIDISSPKEAVTAYREIISNVRRINPLAEIEAVEISEMIKEGVEVIVGAKKDRDFGEIVMFGLGGTFTEVLKDVSFRVLPINCLEAERMVKEIKAYPMLEAIRGGREKDIDEICQVILKIAGLIQYCPEISEIEINPLRVLDKGLGVKALDVRIILG